MSHLGRPDGQRSEKFSLKPVVAELEKLLDLNSGDVLFLDDCVGGQVEKTVSEQSGGILSIQRELI
jgi:phosphoglycerate kinase